RQSLGLQRLEVHAADLRRAETTLAERNGIVDVQRFGDRLDVLVRDVPAGERAVREALAGAGLAVGDVRGATPTLENTFVALLRRLQGEARVPPFPGRRDNGTSEDAVAIGARGLRKVVGGFEAVRGIHLEVRYSSVIINASVGARKGWPTTSTVSTCKAAVVHLARILSAELVDRGIRVNTLSPGPTDTAMFGRFPGEEQ